MAIRVESRICIVFVSDLKINFDSIELGLRVKFFVAVDSAEFEKLFCVVAISIDDLIAVGLMNSKVCVVSAALVEFVIKTLDTIVDVLDVSTIIVIVCDINVTGETVDAFNVAIVLGVAATKGTMTDIIVAEGISDIFEAIVICDAAFIAEKLRAEDACSDVTTTFIGVDVVAVAVNVFAETFVVLFISFVVAVVTSIAV